MQFKRWLILSEKIIVNNKEFRDTLFALKEIQKTHPKPENLIITFTSIDKVGINPQSTYKTPNGIYFYPLSYVIKERMEVPFAGDAPYLNVCELTHPEKVFHMHSFAGKNDGMEMLDVFPKEAVDNAVNAVKSLDIRSNYSLLFLTTRNLANENPSVWNTILRKCGIDGFVDHDTGTIHPNEPTQGVVFLTNALSRLYVIDNKKVVSNINFSKMTDKQLRHIIINNKKELTDDNVQSFLQNATDVDAMATLIINNKKELLTDKNIEYLLLYAAEVTIEKLGQEKMNGFINALTPGEHYNQSLQYAKDKDAIATLIINNKKDLLTDRNVYKLLGYATDVDAIASLIIQYKKELLTDNNVRSLLQYANNKDEIATLIINNKKELTDDDVVRLFASANNKDEIAKTLGSENINKLSDQNVGDLINYAINKDEMTNLIVQYKKELSDNNIVNLLIYAKDKDAMANLIINNKKELTDDNVEKLLSYAKNKYEIANLLGSENIKKLSDNNVSKLLGHAKDKDAMANLIINNKKDLLTDYAIYYLLSNAINKDAIARLIIQYKKDLLTDKNVFSLLRYAPEVTKREISQERMNAYNQNKTS